MKCSKSKCDVGSSVYLHVDFLFSFPPLLLFLRCLDLPRRPRPTAPASSAQNHSRGNEVLIAKVKKGGNGDGDGVGAGDVQHLQGRGGGASSSSSSAHHCRGDGLLRSPGDHPSLRKRRKSKDEVAA